jgi:diaminopimelate epimerase
LSPQPDGQWEKWHLVLGTSADAASISVAILSMGNPHAVLEVPDVDTAPVRTQGPLIENHPRFPNRVTVGFLQVVGRSRIRLRVWERGAGETLACGTGACAAVVAGIRLGRLDGKVDVETHGGMLTVEWAGEGPQGAAPVLMTGPAATVFEGEIEVPQSL